MRSCQGGGRPGPYPATKTRATRDAVSCSRTGYGPGLPPPWLLSRVEISASREKISTFFERQEQKTYDAQIALTGVAGQLMHGDEQHQVPLV
jgi:hypothetical protein